MSDKELNIGYGEFSLSITGYDDPFPIVREVTQFYTEIAKSNPTFGTFAVNASQSKASIKPKAPAEPQENVFVKAPEAAQPKEAQLTQEEVMAPLKLDDSFIAEVQQELAEVAPTAQRHSTGDVVSIKSGTAMTQHAILSNYRRLTAAE